MKLKPMAFTKLLRSATAADMALEESFKRESEPDQTSIPLARSACNCRSSLPDQQARLDVEAQARKEAKRTLASADWYHVSMFLEGLATEYAYTGLCTLVESSRLFFALVEYFREYAVEFQVDVWRDNGPRNLKRALNQLVAIIPNSCFREGRPDYSGQELVATSRSEKSVLLAVKQFLVLKANEKISGAEASNIPNTKTGYVSMNSTPESGSSLNPNISGASNCQLSPRTQVTPAQATPSTTTKSTIAQGLLKRKRLDSRSSIITNIIESAQDLESLCREQEEEIVRLKAQARTRTDKVREIGELKTKIQKFKKEARDWEGEARTLERANETLVVERIDQSTREVQLQGEMLRLEQERDSVKRGWKFEIARKKAIKEMLIVAGGFKAESIEVAAKAISEGKKARDAIADSIRSGDAEALE